MTLPWSDYHVKLVLAGEVFSEEWRTLLGERLGGSESCFGSASLYGTADAGVLATETPLSVCIRRFLAAHPAAARELFGESRRATETGDPGYLPPGVKHRILPLGSRHDQVSTIRVMPLAVPEHDRWEVNG